MSDIVIKVENLSKLYKIGARQNRHDTLRDKLTEAVTAPFRRLSSVIGGPFSAFSHQSAVIGPRSSIFGPRSSVVNSSVLSPRSSVPGPQSSIFGPRSSVVNSSVLGPRSSVVCNDTIWALKDVSFEVKRGEVVGIIGRNGAGKTTLLKILSRITEPTEGQAEICGRVSSLLEVGTGFHPELTGRENIYLNGAILGMKKAEIDRKFDEIVDFAEIEKFIDTPVKHYSSGMYVRLAFAVAAHLEPEILLVDEVLAVGDAAFQKKCLGKMDDVAREGRTVLFVSHNMTAIGRLCGRCILLNNGHIAIEGYARQVIDTYLSEESSTETEIRFPFDQPKAVQVRRIQLLDHNGRTTLTFDRTRPFGVVIEVEAHQDGPNGEVGVSLETLEGVRIFDSVSADEMERYVSFKAGETYLAQVEFPGEILNAGNYRLSVIAVSNHMYLDKQSTPVFRLVNMGEVASFVGGTYDAIILVKARWQIEQK